MTAPDLTNWIPDTPIPVETHPSDYAPTSALISTPNYKLHPWHSIYSPSPLWNSTTRHQQTHWSDRHPLVSNFGFFFPKLRHPTPMHLLDSGISIREGNSDSASSNQPSLIFI